MLKKNQHFIHKFTEFGSFIETTTRFLTIYSDRKTETGANVQFNIPSGEKKQKPPPVQ